MLSRLFGSLTARLVVSLSALLFSFGCTLTLTGGGELAVGMRNDNFFVVKHTIDGDKEGKTASSQMAIDQSILDAVLPSPNDDETSTDTSADSDIFDG